MARHISKPGETPEDFRSGGAEAGDNAGKQMVAQCCPPANRDPKEFAQKLLKASVEATVQMRLNGSSEENVTIWATAFQTALDPHLAKVTKVFH